MTLADYLKSEDITAAEFARRIGATRSIVARWAKGERIPRREAMQQISVVTGGRVGPDDFYEAA